MSGTVVGILPCAGGCGREVARHPDRPGVLRRVSRGRCGTCYRQLRADEGQPCRPADAGHRKRRSDAAPLPTPADLEWTERAVCGESPNRDAFTAPDGSSRWVPARAVIAARRYCGRCPVLDECDAYATRFQQTGLWGGRWWPRQGEPVEIHTVSGIAS